MNILRSSSCALVALFGLALASRAQTFTLTTGTGPTYYGQTLTLPLLVEEGSGNPWNLPPSTPVHAELRVTADWYYILFNRSAFDVHAYQYGQGANYTMHGPLGISTVQLCSNVCGGNVPANSFHEQRVEVLDVPTLGALNYVQTIGDLPTFVSMDTYGHMQEWPGFPSPWLTTSRAAPWAVANRNRTGATILVTVLH